MCQGHQAAGGWIVGARADERQTNKGTFDTIRDRSMVSIDTSSATLPNRVFIDNRGAAVSSSA